ncbi:MAG: Lrp/AsnC ligand binding domain-containing protein [Thermoplasmata archaeon]|nr:Lrp/AsnC ligand binding domain-containing protein [Thermoplasmata archaeon]
MESVYVLIETDSGELEKVVAELRKKQGVREVSAITGPFDVIVKIETEHITEALQTIVHDIRKIKGVKSTETLVCIKL